jgi:hypothetical protein
MGAVPTKSINQLFFRAWSPEMSYVLGYVVADGSIGVDKRRRNAYSFNITSKDKAHLYKLRKTLSSEHKIGAKRNGAGDISFQLQIRNQTIAHDLMQRGILPRKTYNLGPIQVPQKYFRDFVRGFFDGDGSVYMCKVNGTPQIKAHFLSVSLKFLKPFHQRLCYSLDIPLKTMRAHKRKGKMTRYIFDLYIEDCEKLEDFMYQNATLFLDRKRRIFEKWHTTKRRHYRKVNYPSKIGWRLNQKVFA